MRMLHCIPPAPQVMAQLYADYKRWLKERRGRKSSFKEYLVHIGFMKMHEPLAGRDTGRRTVARTRAELVTVPDRVVSGTLNVMVLLVDFPDNIGKRPKHEFEDMLFSMDRYLTGSMYDFYKEVSKGKVFITGSVHGWLRMPHPYGYYVGRESGTGSYPNNAQKLAEDALAVARIKRVPFPSSLDTFGTRAITALFLVHAGPGAEVMTSLMHQRLHIWSHKADMERPIPVGSGLYATNYLTVPEDCRMGVCAHELGHLAFQWDDFYDPDYDQDGTEWAGAGNWDLMAGGSWNDGGNTPAHPAGLHIVQHEWCRVLNIDRSTKDISLPPYDHAEATIVRVRSEAYTNTQCLIIENRTQQGFDAKLPGAGLLVWRVDTAMEENSTKAPAMLLLQADGRHDLERPGDFNTGDTGDPFPGMDGKVVALSDLGRLSTSFPTKRSGIKLSRIRIDPYTKVASFDVNIR